MTYIRISEEEAERAWFSPDTADATFVSAGSIRGTECICEHCKEAGTCWGCTSGLCP